MKKNCFAYFISIKDTHNLKRIMSNDSNTFSNFSKEFGNIFIINLYNLNFGVKKVDNSNFFSQLELGNKYIYFEPKNLKSFKEFIHEKKICGVVSFGIYLSNMKLLYNLKQKNIKLFQISNVGNVNISNLFYFSSNFIKNFFSIITHRLSHILIVILSNLNILPKVEIRFLSNKRWLPNESKNNLFKKIFNKLNLRFAKRLEIINSRSFDILMEDKKELSEKYITVLDEIWNDPQYLIYRDKISDTKLNEHYKNLNKKLEMISNFLNKEIIVCIHPNDNFEEKKNFFPNYKVKKYLTRDYIYQSKIIMLFESSAIIDAIILKKKIITLSSNLMDHSQKYHQNHFNNELKIENLNLQDDLIFDEQTKKKFAYDEEKINFYYEKYIKKNIAADESRMMGYKKVSQILKEEFFNE
tara:strand:+ start:44723 stop:45958 length:1236 start_codon:yes stop_codon:yes gene_type:complete